MPWLIKRSFVLALKSHCGQHQRCKSSRFPAHGLNSAILNNFRLLGQFNFRFRLLGQFIFRFQLLGQVNFRLLGQFKFNFRLLLQFNFRLLGLFNFRFQLLGQFLSRFRLLGQFSFLLNGWFPFPGIDIWKTLWLATSFQLHFYMAVWDFIILYISIHLAD